jgi:hypothetical protein
MANLTKLSDAELLRRIIHAERMADKWESRAFRCCHWVWWEIDDTPRGQEAHHLYLMWDSMMRRLHAEEDRRGGQDALYERLDVDGQRGGG